MKTLAFKGVMLKNIIRKKFQEYKKLQIWINKFNKSLIFYWEQAMCLHFKMNYPTFNV